MVPSSLGRWWTVGVWVAVIFTTVPFVRRLREVFTGRWPAELIAVAVMAAVAAAAIGALVVGLRRRTLSLLDSLWLIAVAAATIWWSLQLMDRPEEAVHFVQYGILGVLLYRALRTHVRDSSIFVAAAVLGSIVGTFDEILQWLVPGRYFDFRDIILNTGASLLTQLAVWRLAAPRPRRWSVRSRRGLCRLLAAEAAILTLCLAATPQRIEAIAAQLPILAPLVAADDVVAEYGHLERIDDHTRFRSRLRLAELAAEDRRRWAEVAARLDASRGAYAEFLHAVSPVSDPFAYEVRVHLFSRGRNVQQGRAASVGSRERSVHLTAAFREQLILETIAPHTVAASSFAWRAPKRDRMRTAQDPTIDYISPVGSHLITWIGEAGLRAVMLVVLAGLLGCDLWLGRLSRPRPARARQRGRNPDRTGPETRR